MWGDMVKLNELSLKRRDYEQAKDAGITLEPKRYAARCPDLSSGHTDITVAGGETEPKSLDKLSVGNVVSP